MTYCILVLSFNLSMSPLYPKKILIVDDEADVRFFLSNILKRAQYAVFSAATGEEAIELAKTRQPDLIVLDILLPGVDGGSVAETLSEDQATAAIPILFLTGILSKEEELLGKKEGGVKSGKHFMMAKPVAKEELLAMIAKILCA